MVGDYTLDTLTKEQRHLNMSRIKGSDTELEMIMRKALWREGVRYRKNYAKLPGKPDIVITKYKIAIFCDSEFWHGKDIDKLSSQVKTNTEFWLNKIKSNVARDRRVDRQLSEMGWTVLRFWGEDIKNNLDKCIDIIKKAISDYVKTGDRKESC